jgi:hypothetical protein
MASKGLVDIPHRLHPLSYPKERGSELYGYLPEQCVLVGANNPVPPV